MLVQSSDDIKADSCPDLNIAGIVSSHFHSSCGLTDTGPPCSSLVLNQEEVRSSKLVFCLFLFTF